jgi:hypothetical protein
MVKGLQKVDVNKNELFIEIEAQAILYIALEWFFVAS